MIDYGMTDFDDFKELNDDELTEKIKNNFLKLEQEYETKNKFISDKVLILSRNGTDKTNNIVV